AAIPRSTRFRPAASAGPAHPCAAGRGCCRTRRTGPWTPRVGAARAVREDVARDRGRGCDEPSGARDDERRTRVTTRAGIVGGGPGGSEAALVAAQLGAEVTLVDRDGAGGSAVLTDCVPSKTLVATAEVMTVAADSAQLGVRLPGSARGDELDLSVDL